MSKWTVDTRIPVAVILTLIAQIFAFGWAAATFNSRLSSLEKSVTRIESVLINLAQVEERQKFIIRRLDRLETNRYKRN